ncbi:hypothetical protein CNMCM5623_009671 [Aspergillus felis]|uniref:Zn(2)-C6 fungal-type domain-containing protein n=1 Tax=Aspergillus felis TaxID=1287682 RepID=A0A8H6PKM4_9EURO|nr:hypothetical protein CNMCM5623_009671 [Aspergillus felis]
MANYYPITGIPVPVRQDPPPRREVASWAVSSEPVDQIQVSLFIRAVRKLQEKNPIQDKLSFYQIAGIHGLPKVEWDGAGGGYYCPHNTFTFPTWHRPYMLLYEQCLYNVMKNDIIPTIPGSDSVKEAWKQAAEMWRLPYWDWAIPQVDYGAGKEKLGVPKLVDDSEVWILKLGEKEKEPVPNPLYKFTNKLNGEEVNAGDKKKMGEFALDNMRSCSTYDAGRNTERRSCLLCRSRKVKCDRQQPCGGCIRAASTCIYPSGTGRAPKRPQQSANNSVVLTRLDRLESIIRQLESQQTQQEQPLDPSAAALPPQGDQRNGRLAIDSTSSVYVSNVLWASLGDEIEELRDMLHVSPSNNDDDEEGDWQEETYEKEEPVGTVGLNAAIMGFRSLAHSLRDYHPSISQSVALFEIFQTNVAPLVKIFHMPTLTKLFWDAVASLDALDCNMEALLFAIYYAAIISTTDQNQCPLGLPRHQALHTYRFAVEQAFARADLLNTQNMILLQAAALFLCALRNEDDSRTVWSLTALIVHIAQAMGLHRDGAAFGLRPLETELRRRLWWFIVGLDQRSSEYHGYEPIVSESSFDTRLPLNINDSDLTADLVEPPTERDGATEMTLSLIGWESIPIVRKVSFIPPHRRQARTTSSGSVTELSLPEREALAEQLQSRLETRYLAYCIPDDPFLFVSATVARLIIARVWLMVHYPRKQVDSSKEASAAPLQANLRDKIFLLALEILELSCSALCNPNIAHWAWRSDTYSQWHAVALVLSEICTRPPCRDCDRAWAAVEILYDRWRMKEHARKGTLWKPIGRLMAKARYVREMQSVDRDCSTAGSSSVMEASPDLPQVAHHSNVTTTLDPLADIFSLAPFMEMNPSLDDLFLVGDDFVQVDMRSGF